MIQRFRVNTVRGQSRKLGVAFGVIAAMGCGGAAFGADLLVPSAFPTVQAALTAAATGDRVIVSPGVYSENLQVAGKSIEIRSSTGNAVDVVLRAPGTGTVLRADDCPSLRLVGVSLKDGTGSRTPLCGSAGLITVFGGAMIGVNSEVELDQCVVSNNTAEQGGAFFMVAGSLTVRRSTLSANGVAAAAGQTACVGAIVRTCDRTAPTPILFEDSLVTGSGDSQGALDLITPYNAPTTVRRTRFEGNSGAVISPLGLTDILVDECVFTMNTGVRPALTIALASENATVRVRRTMFAGNDGDISASMPAGESTLEVTDSQFMTTSGEAGGGAIFYYQQPGGSAVIDRCEFRGVNGVAIAIVVDGGSTTIANSLLAGTQGDAVLVSCVTTPATLRVSNCTIVESAGKGVRTDALLTGTLQVQNSIVARNAGGQIGVPLIPFGQTIEVRRSLIEGGANGVGNFSGDPVFVNPGGAGGDYRLTTGSPAIDAGENALVYSSSTPAKDLDLGARIVDVPGVGATAGAVVDLGAFEFVAAAVCRADADNNGQVEVADIFAFLGAWFGNDLRADISGDGTIGVNDIFGFLSLWFAGC